MNEMNDMDRMINDLKESTILAEEIVPDKPFKLIISADGQVYETEMFELKSDAVTAAIDRFNMMLDTTDDFDAYVVEGSENDSDNWKWRLKSLSMDNYDSWVDAKRPEGSRMIDTPKEPVPTPEE